MCERTSKLNVESQVIKPLTVRLLDWKLLLPAHITIYIVFSIPAPYFVQIPKIPFLKEERVKVLGKCFFFIEKIEKL